jgi:hypothetical protein
VQDIARRDARVQPFAKADLGGDVSLRGIMFEARKHTLRAGDWFARLDADEFFHVSPREFLTQRLRPLEARVFAQHYDFVLTRSLWEQWQRNPTGPDAVQTPPDIRAARTEFIVDTRMWFDARWFRFRPGMKWGKGHPNPFHPGFTAVERIPVRHYRWRNVSQSMQRLANRAAMAKVEAHGEHWAQSDPNHWIVEDQPPRRDPQLLTWTPALAEAIARGERTAPGCPHQICGVNLKHLEWPAKRRSQWWMYRLGLPRVMDLWKRGWEEGSVPASLLPAWRAG